MKEFKKIIISIIIIFSGIIVVDMSFGKVSESIVKNMPIKGHGYALDNYRLNYCEADVVIIGSSRSIHHYVPSMIIDSINSFLNTSLSIVNIGSDGRFVNNNVCAIESILNRYTPKIIIFEIGENELLDNGQEVSDMELLATYYSSNYIVHNYLDDLGLEEQIKMQSSLIRFNGKLLEHLYAYIDRTVEQDYIPLSGKMIVPNDYRHYIDTTCGYSEYSKMNLIRIFEMCNQKNIKLIVSTSPRYCPYDNNNKLAILCDEYSIPYIDLYNLDYFNCHPELFNDPSHLNIDGAELFSRIFIPRLKRYI